MGVFFCGKGLDGSGIHDCHFKYLLNPRLTQTSKLYFFGGEGMFDIQ